MFQNQFLNNILPVVNSEIAVYNRLSIATSLFICVEVLQPSQPNGVMSSLVSLPNHEFTGQA